MEVPVAVELHRYIIGSKGRDVRQLMEDHGVQIHVPPADDNVPVLRVTGPVDNVAGAKHALLVRVQQLEDDRQQRVSAVLYSSLAYLLITLVVGYYVMPPRRGHPRRGH